MHDLRSALHFIDLEFNNLLIDCLSLHMLVQTIATPCLASPCNKILLLLSCRDNPNSYSMNPGASLYVYLKEHREHDRLVATVKDGSLDRFGMNYW